MASFDLIIRNGYMVDGSGEPGHTTDVGINDGRIAAVGALADAEAAETIDATGLVVSPGFIDVHIHSETQLLDPNDRVRYGSVLQGVTTHVAGPDGFGWAGLSQQQSRALWPAHAFAYGPNDLSFDWPTPSSYMEQFAGTTPVNIAFQVPHCAVRFGAMGWSTAAANDEQLEAMQEATRAWFDAGAVALCLGLDYQPSAFADTNELVELSKIAAEYGAVYAAHIRYNDYGIARALEESWEIGERSGAGIHISHEHINDVSRPLFAEGASRCDMSFESYLYPAGCTHLALTLPIWAQEGGPDRLEETLADPAKRERIRDALQAKLERNPSGDRAVFMDTPSGRWVGESIQDVADAHGMTVGEFAIQVLEEEQPYALMLYRRGTPDDVVAEINRETLHHPAMMVASDGMYFGQSAHPRAFGCFAKVLGTHVRGEGAISLEQAIWKMSGFPAERFLLRDRGRLAEGFAADIVLFDPETVADLATWAQPRLEPVGIRQVLVNGVTVARDGLPTSALPGQVL